MMRGKVAAIVGIEHIGDAADAPSRILLAPDRLAQRERRLDGRGGLEVEGVSGDGTAVVVDDDRQPGLGGDAVLTDKQNIQERMIRLPDGVGMIGFAAVY